LQHSEEAAFHWLLRDRAIHAPQFSLRTLGLLESRLGGHLDGLSIAGGPGWALCLKEPGRVEPGGVFTMGVVAFESGDPTRIGQVLAVASKAPALARALASALGWLPWKTVKPHVEVLTGAEAPLLRRAALAAYAVRRENLGTQLGRLLGDETIVRARAFRAAGELGRQDFHDAAKEGLVDSDENCRFWAAFSLALLGDQRALEGVRVVAEAGGPLAERAALLAARAMLPPDALAWQHYLAADEKRLRMAIQVAGAIGDPLRVPWLLEQMEKPAVARVAGEAFTTITGIDLAYHDLERDWPKGFEAGPNDDPDDEDVSMDPDENLPFPNPRLVSEWWSRNRATLRPGIRHLAGQPITVLAIEDLLRKGRQRVRAAAALELALLQPGQPLFEVRAPAARQRAALGM